MIVLNMIVKNEAHCIERCIKSVLPYVDAAVIVDTGSTDGTQELLSGLLWEKEHAVYNEEWVNFGINRTQAFWKAVDIYQWIAPASYAFIMDADEEFLPGPGFEMPRKLDCAGYAMWQAQGGMRHLYPRLLRLDKPWVFQGAVHEYAELLDPDPKRGVIDNCTVTGHFDSARNKDGRSKYLQDARAMENLPATPRNVFYKARCYEGAGEHLIALQYYQQRAQMDGYEEETYLARIGIARMEQLTFARPSVVARAYEAAYHFRPSRAEAPYYLATFCKQRGHHAADYWFMVAAQIPMTTDQLFVDTAAYSINQTKTCH
jgi:glycosyltransferase involved in cell wall biosynthesis